MLYNINAQYKINIKTGCTLPLSNTWLASSLGINQQTSNQINKHTNKQTQYLSHTNNFTKALKSTTTIAL